MRFNFKTLMIASLILCASIANAETIKAPAFALKDQNGKEVKLSDFSGKTVVLEWLNPDCPFVKRHHKAGTMESLAAKFAPKNVVWLGINTTYFMGANDNKEFIEEYKLSYPVLTDWSGEIGKAYGAKTTPFMVVINPSGEIAYEGAIDDDPRGEKEQIARINYVEKALEQLLSKQPIEVASTKSYGCSVKYKS